MKKIFGVLLTFVLIFSSCETDFDVNAGWQEMTVVYGLLDASTDTQYIRINKAYLGEGDAMMMAQYSDSINFNPDDLEVTLSKLGTSVSISLDTISGIIKDALDFNGNPGIFATDNHIIYRAITPSNFLTKNFRYAISIENLISGNSVSSSTEVISDFSFKDFSSSSKWGFYNPFFPDSTKFTTKTVKWQKVEHGEVYQVDVRFNYLENGELKSLLWSQEQEVFEGSTMQIRMEGIDFFNFLTNSLVADNSIIREFVNLDLIMTVGTESLNNYITANGPVNDLAQQRPQFSNIDNGIGIFSSRYTYTEYDLELSDYTLDYLINELDRNFQ